MVPFLKTFPKRVSIILFIVIVLLWITITLNKTLSPFVKNTPLNFQAWAKFSDSGAYIIGTAILVYGTAAWSDAADDAQDRSYRY